MTPVLIGWTLPHRLAAVLAAIPSIMASATDPVFTNQTAAAGVNVAHATGGFSQSQYCGGGAVGDFNRDGLMDFFMISGGNNNHADYLFINNGDGTFTDRAIAWGLTEAHRGKSCCVGDYDHDGWLDLYVTSAGIVGQPIGPGHHRLYRNNGDGTFTDVAAIAGVNFADPSAESAWTSVFGDYDLDGDLDLFVGGFSGSPSNTEHHLLKNNGNGTFTDVTSAIGLFSGVGPVAALSARFADIDGDRYPELLIGGDFKGSGSYIGSRYFRNDTDGTFTDITVAANTGHEENGMGQTILDYNNDGLMDWYVTSIYWIPFSWTGNKLYRNNGASAFSQVAAAMTVDNGGYGWGTVGVDVNNDGWEDIAETGGDASSGSQFYSIPARLWINNGGSIFTNQANSTGFIHSIKGRSLLRIDYDNDGDQDILIFRYNGELTLFRNDLPPSTDTSWLRVMLDTTAYPALAPDGLGARVVVKSNGVTRTRVMDCGVSFLGTSEFTAHFGLGTATVAQQIQVLWPNGSATILNNVAINRTIIITPTGILCPSDLNFDDVVDGADVGLVLAGWGTASPDLNGDGTTNGADLGLLLAEWGSCQ